VEAYHSTVRPAIDRWRASELLTFFNLPIDRLTRLDRIPVGRRVWYVLVSFTGAADATSWKSIRHIEDQNGGRRQDQGRGALCEV
jgi:hypothetical protein